MVKILRCILLLKRRTKRAIIFSIFRSYFFEFDLRKKNSNLLHHWQHFSKRLWFHFSIVCGPGTKRTWNSAITDKGRPVLVCETLIGRKFYLILLLELASKWLKSCDSDAKLFPQTWQRWFRFCTRPIWSSKLISSICDSSSGSVLKTIRWFEELFIESFGFSICAMASVPFPIGSVPFVKTSSIWDSSWSFSWSFCFFFEPKIKYESCF